jgi:fructokinase
VKFSNDRISDFDSIFPSGQAPLEIQTVGKDGLMFRRKGCDSWITLPSYSIEGVVDSAGAGDWCTAGLVFNLFRNTTSINAISDTDIKDALRFGQVLSALNCTFEGARGLMYNYNRVELVLAVQHILSLASSKIPTKQKPRSFFSSSFGNFQTLKISSLL